MNRDIEYISNVSAYAVLTNTGSFSMSGGFPPLVDEVVVRQISYSSQSANRGILHVQCDINGGTILGSVVNATSFTAGSGTRVQIRNPMQPSITFTLMTANLPAGSIVNGDFISISLDFIKYRK